MGNPSAGPGASRTAGIPYACPEQVQDGKNKQNGEGPHAHLLFLGEGSLRYELVFAPVESRHNPGRPRGTDRALTQRRSRKNEVAARKQRAAALPFRTTPKVEDSYSTNA